MGHGLTPEQPARRPFRGLSSLSGFTRFTRFTRFTGLSGFAQLSIRNKLLVLVLMPLAVVLPLLGVLLLVWGDTALDRLLITKVRSDLAVAQGYFERVLGEVGASTTAVAESHALLVALAAAQPTPIVGLLQRLKEREKLDFINLRDAQGALRYSDSAGAGAAALEVAGTTADLRERTSVEVLTFAQQAFLGPVLRERVAVPLVDTRNAAPSARRQEDRAMVLLSSRAIRDADGRVLGHVQAGVLLNRNLPFIDHINAIVYPEGALPFGSRGTATLFLDDVRISTNVRLFGAERDQRAIGTRVSQAVHAAVLDGGRTWLDRAFVVNDWYVSAYQALQDSAGTRIGMLYVGFSEAPFRWIKLGVLLSIGVIFFAVMIGAALVCLHWARSIFAPLERMASTMQQVERGDMQARVGALASRDEVGQLAGHLDQLLDVVGAHTRALQSANAELDAKVAARTSELQAAQQQLVRAEKLAAVGQLTASIAHEVNNPIAVLQGNLDLVRELLGEHAAPVRSELQHADQQIERMRLIVTQLLQFARPAEYAGYIEAVDTRQLIDDSLLLVGHLLAKTRIELQRDLQATRSPAINRSELQQVLVNLLVNAIHAMPEGGVLLLTTRDVGDELSDEVDIAVADTGSGLGAELIAELFKPFVTRKKDGTGLGLWISRSIVERYGGEIRAADRSDALHGAIFTVRLRCEK